MIDVARRRLEQAGEHLDRGGLARGVRAEEGEEFALRNFEVEAVDRLERPEMLGQSVDADHGWAAVVIFCVIFISHLFSYSPRAKMKMKMKKKREFTA